MNRAKKILIVEDEILIAKHIKKYLFKNGYDCSDININYNGAIKSLETKSIDLVLLDININGEKDGIDIAKYINKKLSIPFFFLTTYNDTDTLEKLKEVNPVGYLNKPINESTLITNLDIFFKAKRDNLKNIIPIEVGSKIVNVDISKLLYVETDHIYLKLYFLEKEKSIRISLSSFLKIMPEKTIFQMNRGLAVNLNFIDEIGKNTITIKGKTFKISKNFIENYQYLKSSFNR